MAGVLSPSVAPPPACPAPMKATSNGAWQKENPLDYALPLVILQICLVVALTRALAFLLRRLRQPRVIAEIIGGILLGPSALGRNQAFLDAVFPKRSLTLLDTLANIGLLFFLFLVGLELDLNSIRRTGREALAIAVAGISLPFVLGVGTSFVLRATIAAGVPQAPFLVFMGVALSITAFPVLARILAELKLLTTDVGRMAMSAAAVNDVVAWILLALAVALSGSGSPLVSLWVLISGALFVVLAALAIRPVLVWMAHRCQEGEPVKEIYICVTLATVLAASFITDTIGIHALFGAFVVGIVVPKEGPFACILIEKIEDLVSGLLLPLYFVSSGLKTNIATISSGRSWGLLVLVITTSCLGKVVGTIAAARIARVPSREALTLGVLMNTKGLVELIVLNIGKDRKVLNEETFAIMVLMALFTTFITTPIVMAIYKPARPPVPYKNRTIMSLANQPDSKLRMLACFNRARSIPSIINLIETSRGIGSRRGLTVYALHLMELSERSSAISMVNRVRNGFPFWNRGRSSEGDGNNHIEVAFEAYEQLSGVSVRPMMAISDLSTIHEDVVALAQEKRVAMILLPFHKQQCIDNFMESLGASFRHINKSVLEHAPCSVGILVDRGLGGQAQVTSSDVSCSIAVLFFGGRDDREALSYGTRMAHHPGVVLTVLRFQTEPGKTLIENSSNGESVGVNVEGDQRAADDEFMMASSKNCLMKCMVKTVKDKADIVNGISALGPINLFLVGRTPPVAALTSRTDCPELGPVGSYLASSEFSTAASVLVVQQYHPNGNDELPIQAHLSQGGNEASDAANGSQP